MGTIEAKANPAKHDKVAILEEKIGKAQSIIFADYRGLSVAQINDLRRKFFTTGSSEFVVAKNTLMRIALANKGIQIEDETGLKGPTGIGFGYDDPVAPAKTLADFAKTNDKLVLKSGFVDGQYYGTEQVKQLAAVPPVEQLYAAIVGSISSPLSNFVGLMNEIVRSFVGVIDAIIQQKQAAGAE